MGCAHSRVAAVVVGLIFLCPRSLAPGRAFAAGRARIRALPAASMTTGQFVAAVFASVVGCRSDRLSATTHEADEDQQNTTAARVSPESGSNGRGD